MSRGLRRTVYALSTVLWLSGALWLVLHLMLAPPTQFGPAPNPWEPTVMRVHGLIAVAVVFLLGWLTAEHVRDRWRRPRRRTSGAVLGSAALVLVVSGYALYYTTDALHSIGAATHEVLGVGALVLGLAHWWRHRRHRHHRVPHTKLRLTNQNVPSPTRPAETTSVTRGRGSESRSLESTATKASSANTTLS